MQIDSPQKNSGLGASSMRAARIRRRVLDISMAAQTSHIGSSLSCIEILEAALSKTGFDLNSPTNEFVLSKGHAAPALYSALAEHGYLNVSDLEHYATPGSKLEEHPNHFIPYVPTPSGSLGHGLAFGAGFVLAGMRDETFRQATVVMSDGECNEGTVWEAAIFAGSRTLTNLTVIIDSNSWQATGRTAETFGSLRIGNLFHSAGWEVKEVDGHNLEELTEALDRPLDSPGKPLCIVASTVKGKGVSFMEDDNNWHYRSLDEASYQLAINEGLSGK